MSDVLCSQQETLKANRKIPLTRSQRRARKALSREDNWELILKARGGDEGAFRTLLDSHMGLIHDAAKRLKWQGATKHLPLDDLVQAGRKGLWDVVQLWDMTLGASFDTYAIIRIQGEMKDALRENSLVSRPLIKAEKEARCVYVKLEQELLRRPTLSEWKHALLPPLQEEFEAIRVFQAMSEPRSLARFDAEGREVFLDVIDIRESTKPFEDGVIARDNLKKFVAAVNQALVHVKDPRQREIIFWRYLVPEKYVCTLFALGEKLGVTESRVKQLENEALDLLRERIPAY